MKSEKSDRVIWLLIGQRLDFAQDFLHAHGKRILNEWLALTLKLAIVSAMSKTVNIAEFKDRFSELLALVEQGGEVIVCRRNVPLARVEPIRKPAPRKPQHSVVGCMKGTVRIHGDLTEPCLPEADWEMLK
ncbi:MAG: type II toxin-antitoxin system prevent-host-death family antitoxin [Verrucomicrobiota bacterium]